MNYEIDNRELLVQVDRKSILDINVGDTIKVNGMSTPYSWTAQDQQLVESNPDAEILLKMERNQNTSAYSATGVIIHGND
jgi:hypothetical protein